MAFSGPQTHQPALARSRMLGLSGRLPLAQCLPVSHPPPCGSFHHPWEEVITHMNTASGLGAPSPCAFTPHSQCAADRLRNRGKVTSGNNYPTNPAWALSCLFDLERSSQCSSLTFAFSAESAKGSGNNQRQQLADFWEEAVFSSSVSWLFPFQESALLLSFYSPLHLGHFFKAPGYTSYVDFCCFVS